MKTLNNFKQCATMVLVKENGSREQGTMYFDFMPFQERIHVTGMKWF